MTRTITEDDIRDRLNSRSVIKIDPSGLRIAAVLVPLFKKGGRWHVLLTRRSENVEHHKGEISFPGGHMDPGDPDLAYTALRETEEEVGIPAGEVRVLGRLDDIATLTGFYVRPFVGVIAYPFKEDVSNQEIDEVIALPLSSFMLPENFERMTKTWWGKEYQVFFFHVGGHTVWGATARILKQFIEVVLGFTEPGPACKSD